MNKYYFTFMSRHVFGNHVQPIVAKDRQTAMRKMNEQFADDWFSDYDEEQWISMRELGDYPNVIERKTIYCGQVMTFGEMLGWTKRFNQILGASQRLKDKRLGMMLNDLVLAHNANDYHAEQMHQAIIEELD